jgi:hypothetical protein
MSRRSIRHSEIAALESGLSLISGSLTSVHANCPKLSQPIERPVISGFERVEESGNAPLVGATPSVAPPSVYRAKK